MRHIKIDEIIDKIKFLNVDNFKKTVFLIANTVKTESSDFYTLPVREYRSNIVSGVVVCNDSVAESIAVQVDGAVDYIFVDAEKKIAPDVAENETSGDIEKKIESVITRSTLISYKANDLTVDAADSLISTYLANKPINADRKRVGIVGSGNIGSKLALKLVERNMDVFLFRRNHSILQITVDFINNIKNKNTGSIAYAVDSSMDACIGVDVIIGATNGIPVITLDIIDAISNKPLIIDIGKGSISESAIKCCESRGIDILRLSVESALEGLIISLISANTTYVDRAGRGLFYGIKVASGGFIARSDELVVDNYKNPKHVYGIGNGKGDFNRDPDKVGLDLIQKLKNKIISIGNN